LIFGVEADAKESSERVPNDNKGIVTEIDN
jgi:hypothetical protein